ncbi:hypothetical protein LDL08_00520 [Nonomuraea glycinis]|uniref:hypothetical protein n=1 Tax=Nonomuraea glycinis TaxID=2047744 RepID=UPI00166CC418|nr:hypothetical protein [Nonomuraea glycinis]MCA2174660.1 hypothetical protein [Nonomuraea glycinis]
MRACTVISIEVAEDGGLPGGHGVGHPYGADQLPYHLTQLFGQRVVVHDLHTTAA